MTGDEVLQSVRETMRLDRRLLWILGMALIIRVVSFPLLHAGGYTSDEGEYIYLAQRISQGEGSLIRMARGQLGSRSIH